MNLFTFEMMKKVFGDTYPVGNADAKFMFEFLSVGKELIMEKASEFTPVDLWYSQYYWLHSKMRDQSAGLEEKEEQLDALTEEMRQSGDDIDWNIVQSLDMMFSK